MSYGSDVWCTESLVTGRLARGRAVVAQAMIRRLTTPRGTLAIVGGDEEAVYGFDLSEYIGAVGTSTALQALPAIVRGELLKDDRVIDVDVTVTLSTEPDSVTSIDVQIIATLVDSDETLTLSVRASDVTTTLLGVS